MIEFLSQPWPWYVSGPLITLVMLLMCFNGKTFGVSSNLRTLCSAAGAGKRIAFFNFDWKSNVWNLVFLLGAVLGGVIAGSALKNPEKVQLSEHTELVLKDMGIENNGLVPTEIFGLDAIASIKGVFILIISGFLIGFGARYAGGCTSGHAISGLSNLQLPSLIAVVGFFIGGLVMVHVLFNFIF